MDISDSSLTFLDACDKIVLYSGVSKKVLRANWAEIKEILAVILNTDYRDVEPYLKDGVIEMKRSLMKEMDIGNEDFNGSARSQIQHV